MKVSRIRHILEKLGALRILVIGDVILDHYIWGDVARISPEAPVPLVDISAENHRLGGAANVACNLQTLGLQTLLCGSIGADKEGKTFSQLLQSAGIEWKGGGESSTRKTICKSRVVARNQQLCRLDREGRRSEYAMGPETWRQILHSIEDELHGILLSDYAKGVIDPVFLEELRRFAGERKLPVFCDPKPRFNRDFSGMELLTPNRAEAVALSGLDWDPKDPFPAREIITAIHEKFHPRYLVVTLGAEGMLYAENGTMGGIVPTYAREVFDVSGAGDTVIAVLAAALLAGAELTEAVMIANTAAGVVVGKLGTATAGREEILAYAEQHHPGS